MNIETLIRKNILQLRPYSSARDEFVGKADIYLDANENPYDTTYNRYPDPLQKDIKLKLGSLKNVNPSRIFLGNGSDEAIDLLIRAFCEPYKEAVLVTEPTYGMYSVCAGVNGVPVINVNLTSDFDLDDDAILKVANERKVKIIFLCSPNNPSGNLLSREKIRSIINEFNGIVVIDEAYIDFTAGESWVDQLNTFENLAVLQTFSKAWGLAGLRLGMCFASEAIINTLNKIKYPYNVNQETQSIALLALGRREQKEAWVKEIVIQRNRLASELAEIPVVKKVFPSDANFLLVKMADAPGVYKILMNDGIIVRDRSNVILCDNCLRITVGTPVENDRLIARMKTIEIPKADIDSAQSK